MRCTAAHVLVFGGRGHGGQGGGDGEADAGRGGEAPAEPVGSGARMTEENASCRARSRGSCGS